MMRADSLAGQILAVVSRRTPAFQPSPDEPSTFPGRLCWASLTRTRLLTWANKSADTDVRRSTDTSRIDVITFPPPLRRSSSDSTGTAAPHDRGRRDNAASEERSKGNMLAGPETQFDEPGRRSPRKRINAILAAASLLAGFALLAALFEPDGATQEFVILSITATIGATIAFSCARNEQMAAVLTAALGVAAIVLGITAVVGHLYP
jgi:hypothetical protein